MTKTCDHVEQLGQKDKVNWLTSKFIMSQPGLQTIHILLNTSQSKYDETMKSGHLKQNITKEIFLFKNYAENEAG